jgi:hypothetical protein
LSHSQALSVCYQSGLSVSRVNPKIFEHPVYKEYPKVFYIHRKENMEAQIPIVFMYPVKENSELKVLYQQ